VQLAFIDCMGQLSKLQKNQNRKITDILFGVAVKVVDKYLEVSQ
jgi:hypothetical protein